MALFLTHLRRSDPCPFYPLNEGHDTLDHNGVKPPALLSARLPRVAPDRARPELKLIPCYDRLWEPRRALGRPPLHEPGGEMQYGRRLKLAGVRVPLGLGQGRCLFSQYLVYGKGRYSYAFYLGGKGLSGLPQRRNVEPAAVSGDEDEVPEPLRCAVPYQVHGQPS